MLSLQAHPKNTYLSPKDLQAFRPVLFLNYSMRREVVLRGSLPPGRYIIVPSTAEPNQPGAFLLRVLTEQGNAATWVTDQLADIVGKVFKKRRYLSDIFTKMQPSNVRMRLRILRGLLIISMRHLRWWFECFFLFYLLSVQPANHQLTSLPQRYETNADQCMRLKSDKLLCESVKLSRGSVCFKASRLWRTSCSLRWSHCRLVGLKAWRAPVGRSDF